MCFVKASCRVLLVILLLLFSVNSFSQYVNIQSGNYDSPSCWSGNVKPVDTWKTIQIVSNTTITKDGDFSWGPAVVVNGTFNVNGSFTSGYGGLTVNGALSVVNNFNGNLTSGENSVVNVGSFTGGNFNGQDGCLLNVEIDFNGNLTCGTNSTVNVGSFLGGTFNGQDGCSFNVEKDFNGNLTCGANSVVDVGSFSGGSFNGQEGCSLTVEKDFNGNLTCGANSVVNFGSFSGGSIDIGSEATLTISKPDIKGALNITSASFIRSNGTVVVYGDFYSNQKLTVELGGKLIVYGNMFVENDGCVFNGNVVVTGDVNINNTMITNTGNLVVGGKLTIPGGGTTSQGDIYLLNPNAGHDINVNLPVKKPGNEEDLANSGDDALLDLVAEVGLISSPAYKWVGGASASWEDPNNWESKKFPDANKNVSISVSEGKNAPVITGSASMKNLSIVKGALTVKPGAKVTVEGNIQVTAPGALVIEHDLGSQPASFIHRGISTGDVSVRVTYPLLARNWYQGHPVATNRDSYTSKGTFSIWSFAHLADKEEWTVVANNAVMTDPTQAFVVNNGTGAIQTVEHKGALASGSPSFTLIPNAKYRWNLVANPFNGYLDPSKLDFSSIDKTIWYRTVKDLKYNFVTYNEKENITVPADADKLIAPMQAFWVRVEKPGQLDFKKSALVHPTASNPMMKSSSVSDRDVLYLELRNDKTSDQMAIACRLSGSTTFGSGDSEKRLSGGVIPNLYSLKGGKTSAINIQPEMPASEGVALGYSIGTGGNNGLSLQALNIASFMPEMGVYLEDRTTGTRIDLRANPEYAFTSDPMTNNSRFVLKFEKISTGVENDVVAEQKGERIRIFGQQDKAIVLVGSELLRQGNARINIYNLAGSLMSTHEVSDTRSELTLPAAPGIYLVEAEAGGQVKREKVVK